MSYKFYVRLKFSLSSLIIDKFKTNFRFIEIKYTPRRTCVTYIVFIACILMNWLSVHMHLYMKYALVYLHVFIIKSGVFN